MEHGPFEDLFPIENGDIPASYVSLLEGITSNHPGCLFDDLSIWELYIGMHVVLHYTWPSGVHVVQWSFRNLWGKWWGGCLG